jgi:lipopolysaccharide/colanic/teichoic acid biosynthesis glycosyltransferase
VDCYVQLFREEYAVILESRPGLTDLASLAYANEEQVLARASDPDEEYRRCVLPHKIRLAKESIDRSSLLFDIQIILRTVLAVAIRR